MPTATPPARSQPRETLAGLLWPDYPESSARQSLSQSLFVLRGALGDHDAQPPYLLVTRDALQINPESDYSLDVAALEADLKSADDLPAPEAIVRLEETVALYRGAFLEGFSCSGCLPFKEWARLKREEYHRRALAALYRLAELYEQQGDKDHAQLCARRQVELEPSDEAAHHTPHAPRRAVHRFGRQRCHGGLAPGTAGRQGRQRVGRGRVSRGLAQELDVARSGGHIVLAAHSDIKGETFRHLDQLEDGDPLTLVTCWPYPTVTSRYIVIARPVVSPG